MVVFKNGHFTSIIRFIMVYVFKTSVKYKKQIKEVSKGINQISEIEEWNFDLEDCDNILRVVSKSDVSKKVCKKLNSLNYICQELH